MSIATYNGTVENGKIKLQVRVKLPNNSKVYVIVPEKVPKFNLSEMAANMPKDYMVGKEVINKPEYVES